MAGKPGDVLINKLCDNEAPGREVVIASPEISAGADVEAASRQGELPRVRDTLA
jgi:hypothetical protein